MKFRTFTNAEHEDNQGVLTILAGRDGVVNSISVYFRESEEDYRPEGRVEDKHHHEEHEQPEQEEPS